MHWQFLNTGFNSGRFNMELDELLAHRLQDGTGTPTVRVYGWNPPAISLGFNQRMEDFDAEKLRQAGIDIVRRPTGGRAILHAHELTYSVVAKLDGRTPRAIYHFINDGLLCGLKYLGIDAELSGYTDDFRRLYQNPESIPCFSSSAKNEIQYDGKKLVGSAQRRFRGVVLQHGSMLLGSGHRRIVNFLASHVQESRSTLDETLATKTIDIQSILGRAIAFEEAAAAVKRGFENACSMTFEDIGTPIEDLVVDRGRT